ncbi:MAG: Oligopeptide transport system permease protein OppC [Chloroflexi bacterium ADurb.Bin325]|nr:MAG: Oligopeptide transport system permease protein OppC [Chloroflexi bacterium ADurb.Bin325]
MSEITPATSIPPTAPGDPASASPPMTEEFQEREAQVMVASQWKLIWWKFRKHKLAMFSAVVVIAIYVVAAFAEFFSPFPPDQYVANYTYAPPQALHFFDSSDGSLRFGLYVSGYKVAIDTFSLRRTFVSDPEVKIPVTLFAKGWDYKLLGIIPTNRHIIGPVDGEGPMYLLGADHMGRDLLSRIAAGTRISMSIGLLGVAISLVLGILLGGISGYYGGVADNVIQRLIEFLRSLPTIPLWMSLAAALPVNWPPQYVYFGITLILSFIGWTGLARVVRGRFLALREEDFVLAAKLDGAPQLYLILRHMAPSFASHIIASITLAIPAMILSETALSFLGLGLRPPIVSWGVLLQDAQNVRAVSTAPWLLLPGVAVVIAVLSLNFFGDGLRDAADPYGR